MTEDKQPQTPAPKDKPAATATKEKPPALEDKPFAEFIEQHFIPTLQKSFASQGIDNVTLSFVKDSIPLKDAANTSYWQVKGNWQQGQRQFNLYFLKESIQGQKAFSCSTGEKPSIVESFMIDERKVTLDLLVLYTIQRLNGQKWLARN